MLGGYKPSLNLKRWGPEADADVGGTMSVSVNVNRPLTNSSSPSLRQLCQVPYVLLDLEGAGILAQV